MPPVAQIVIWGQISFFQYITSLLLYFTKICIHKLIPMIQLNIVILSAYTSICNTRHQMHNISVGDLINISCISYTISYKIKYSNGSKKPMRVMGSRSVIVLWSYTSKQEAYLPLKNVGLVSHHTPDINFITFYTIQHIDGGTLKHLTIFCSRCPIGHRSVLVQANKCWLSSMTAHGAGILPVTGPANEWWSYMATPSLTDQSHIKKWSLMVLPGLNELRNDSVIYQLFKKFLNPVWEISVLIPYLTIIFQMTAPMYFIPGLPWSVFTAGIWKWSAIIVLYSWISLFLLKKCENISDTFPQL